MQSSLINNDNLPLDAPKGKQNKRKRGKKRIDKENLVEHEREGNFKYGFTYTYHLNKQAYTCESPHKDFVY